MTLRELIDAFRVRAKDAIAPYIWDDTDIAFWLNEADKEAALRGQLIHDETTAVDASSIPVCSITLVASTASYAISQNILKIEKVKLSNGTKLTRTSKADLDRGWPTWEAAAAGTPQYWFENGLNQITLVPKPSAIDTVSLTVKRLPLTPMTMAAANTDTPEVPERYHYALLDWALHYAYLVPDTDGGDKAQAERFAADFERSFGARPDANVQRKQRDRQPTNVKSSW